MAKSKKRDGLHLFPSEIWLKILPLLQNPVPAPLSKPERTQILQPHLAAAIRTCKLFNKICIPLLYESVVTDSFSQFLLGGGGFSRAQRHNFSLVRHLYVEYMSHPGSTPYKTLLERRGAWRNVGFSGEEEERNIHKAAEMEVHEMMNTFSELTRSKTSDIFPRLKTLAVASIYGGKEEFWKRHEELYPEDPEDEQTTVSLCMNLFDVFLLTINITHLCLRDARGPFGLRQLSPRPAHANSHKTDVTIHFGATTQKFALFIGRPIKWVSDVYMNDDWLPQYQKIIKLVTDYSVARDKYSLNSTADTLNLDVYLSTHTLHPTPWNHRIDNHIPSLPRLDRVARKISGGKSYPLSDDIQREIVAKIGQRLQADVRQGSEHALGRPVKDMIKWHAAADIPRCLACGSGAPGEGILPVSEESDGNHSGESTWASDEDTDDDSFWNL